MKKSIALSSLNGKTLEKKAKTEQSTLPKVLLIPLSLSVDEAWEVFKQTFKIGKK